MTTSPSANTFGNNNSDIPFLFSLIDAGLADNYFKFPIFRSIDSLIGSIFTMRALQFSGLGRSNPASAMVARLFFTGYT
jgi:hypothetical protein